MNKTLNFLKGKRIRYWGIGLIVALIAVFVLLSFNSANASNAATDSFASVVSLNMTETVEASGSLAAQPSASLTWNTGGVVEEVYVKVGDQVREGDVLMKLKTTSVSANIISAQADLVAAQRELDDLLSSSDTDLARAVIELKDTQEAYDKAVNYLHYLQTSQKVPQSETRLILQTKRNSWMYLYKTKTFKGPAPEDWIIEAENDLALKKAELEDIQRTYDLLKDGPNAQDVIAAQARVDAAQATVDSMSIIAPFDGEVLSVDNQIGDSVEAGELSINLANLDHLYVTTQVDESDIAKVKLGNPVTATLDAVPGLTLTGRVTAINPVGEVVSGLVKYNVRIELDKAESDTFLPLGTTANVVIHVKEASDTLAVPITAIQNDSQGEYVWLIQGDGSTKRVDIVSGSIIGELVAVTGDLKEGDPVQLLQNNDSSMLGPFGGGNRQ
ncbi:MAG: efflux RND transporter periplasmic adaptor subunit [Anaerolineales bacterium]|nr:efflux RND transporter periplasmic adaptor subunit [Anaerolineales bacterium]